MRAVICFLVFICIIGCENATMRESKMSIDSETLDIIIDDIRGERIELWAQPTLDGSGYLYKSTATYQRVVRCLSPEQITKVDEALGPPKN